jgi:general secretion pathway protein N
MRGSSLVALGLAAYGVFLVATIPAAYVAAQVQSALPGRIEIADTQGTLWRGKARVRISPSRAIPVSLDHVDWRFVPARLLAGEVAFQLQGGSNGWDGAMQLARGLSSWHVRGAKVEGDAAGLARLAPIVGAWRPAGPIALAAPEIAIRGSEVSGTFEARWRNAVIGLSDVRPLGSYRATWRADKGPGEIEVTTLQGPLRVTGKGTTGPHGRFAFRGEARADESAAKPLEPLLDLMGPRRPDGARALDLRLE